MYYGLLQSVVRGDDGVYHMYAAEIYGFCGMNVWLANSIVIHASSPDPATQPFTRHNQVHGVFSHEPAVARAPTGEYVVFFTAAAPPYVILVLLFSQFEFKVVLTGIGFQSMDRKCAQGARMVFRLLSAGRTLRIGMRVSSCRLSWSTVLILMGEYV